MKLQNHEESVVPQDFPELLSFMNVIMGKRRFNVIGEFISTTSGWGK